MNSRIKFKRITIINFIEEFKEFKDDMNKYFIKLQGDCKKCLREVKKHNDAMNEMMETIQDLKREFRKEIEILKRTQAEMKTELKSPN